jgi:hypothetical protein
VGIAGKTCVDMVDGVACRYVVAVLDTTTSFDITADLNLEEVE